VKAVVLLSGGLDSTLCATLAVQEYGANEVMAVSIAYGQKHSRELQSARDVALHLGIHHDVEQLPVALFQGAGSTLIDAGRDTPNCSYEEIQGVSPTYVPFRNGILLSIVAAVALTHGAGLIYFGAHAEDSRNWAYPDTTPEFIGSIATAIYIGTYHKVRLITPLQWMTKEDIVRESLGVHSPVHLTWSCYREGEAACGQCPTCISRLEAFSICGVIDPVKYEGP
jgi:7-cyano-7-deazaguanine synthase